VGLLRVSPKLRALQKGEATQERRANRYPEKYIRHKRPLLDCGGKRRGGEGIEKTNCDVGMKSLTCRAQISSAPASNTLVANECPWGLLRAFYAGSGNDCGRALELVRANVRNLPTRLAVKQVQAMENKTCAMAML
jgi:hypothetical protein